MLQEAHVQPKFCACRVYSKGRGGGGGGGGGSGEGAGDAIRLNFLCDVPSELKRVVQCFASWLSMCKVEF